MLPAEVNCRTLSGVAAAVLLWTGCASTHGAGSGVAASRATSPARDALVCHTRIFTPCGLEPMESTIAVRAEGGTGLIRRGVRCGDSLRIYDLGLEAVRLGEARWSLRVRDAASGNSGSVVVSIGSRERLVLGDSAVEFDVELVDSREGS